MPIRQRIIGRPRPENDAQFIRKLTDALKDEDVSKLLLYLGQVPNLEPRFQLLADKGNKTAIAVLEQYRGK